jgi:hypothetical protein
MSVRQEPIWAWWQYPTNINIRVVPVAQSDIMARLGHVSRGKMPTMHAAAKDRPASFQQHKSFMQKRAPKSMGSQTEM